MVSAFHHRPVFGKRKLLKRSSHLLRIVWSWRWSASSAKRQFQENKLFRNRYNSSTYFGVAEIVFDYFALLWGIEANKHGFGLHFKSTCDFISWYVFGSRFQRDLYSFGSRNGTNYIKTAKLIQIRLMDYLRSLARAPVWRHGGALSQGPRSRDYLRSLAQVPWSLAAVHGAKTLQAPQIWGGYLWQHFAWGDVCQQMDKYQFPSII